jgi:hypothetical protein
MNKLYTYCKKVLVKLDCIVSVEKERGQNRLTYSINSYEVHGKIRSRLPQTIVYYTSMIIIDGNCYSKNWDIRIFDISSLYTCVSDYDDF